MLEVNTTLTVAPLQMVAVVVLVRVGFGTTVTFTTCFVPTTPPGEDVGVIV